MLLLMLLSCTYICEYSTDSCEDLLCVACDLFKLPVTPNERHRYNDTDNNDHDAAKYGKCNNPSYVEVLGKTGGLHSLFVFTSFIIPVHLCKERVEGTFVAMCCIYVWVYPV